MASFADILGGLGDSISVGAGGDANYQNKQNNAKFADAITTFQTDPVQGLQKLMTIDRKGATDWYDNYQKNQISSRKADSEIGRNTVQNATDQDKIDAVTLERLADMAGTGNAANWGPLRERMNSYAVARGTKLPFDIPGAFDQGFVTKLPEYALTAKDAASQRETQRYHDIQNQNVDANRLVNANLGQARVMAGLANQQNSNARAAQRVGSQESRSAAAEAGRNQRAAQARSDRTIAAIVKANPGATIQRNKTTGAVRYSTDGGKTWNTGN